MKRLIPVFLLLLVANTLLAYDFKQKQVCYSIMTLGESDNPVAVVSQQEASADNYKRITELVIPETVKYKGTEYPVAAIGKNAFEFAQSLTSITLPASIVSIQASAFINCTSLKQVTCLDGSMLQTIDDDAFSGCISLTDLNLGHKLQHIGQRAFISCTSLQTINLGTALKRINDRAFAHCTALTSFTIPVSTEYLGKDIFDGCTSLTSLSVLARSCMVDKDYMSNTIKSQITHISFGNGVEHIPAYICQDMTQLTSISMPYALMSIGSDAFSGCTALSKISFYSYNKFRSIHARAFSGCTALTDIALPETLQEIHEHAFEGCTSLSHIRIPKNVTTLHPKAFHGCSSIRSIEWSPTHFESSQSGSIFELIAPQITRFTFSSGVTYVPSRLCQDMTSLSSVILPNTITSIGTEAFYHCSSLSSVQFSSSLKEIGMSAFEGCSSITSLTLPEYLTSLGVQAFASCQQLQTLKLPASLTKIGDSAFRQCSSLNTVHFVHGLTSIGKEAFALCSSLTSIQLPSSVTSCDNMAFAHCTSLQTVQLSKNMSTLNYGLFKDCSSLQSIELPSSINFIGSEAFANCYKLTDIHHPTGNIRVAENALANCSATLIVPYMSNDLKMMFARGPVKSIVYIYTGDYPYNDTINYTPNGKRIYVEEEIVFEVSVEEYDSEGRPVAYADEMTVSQWTYNNNGFVATHLSYSDACGGTTTYEYNEKNEVVKTTEKGSCEPGGIAEYYRTNIYSNYKYDVYGNWISRDVKEEGKGYIYSDSDKLVHAPEYDISEFNTETRVIIYY